MNTAIASIFDTGSVIDEKWVLLERIGKGGMGEVYRAHQLNLKRDVAIKLISTDVLQDVKDNVQEVENLRARFEREVQAMGQVRHPNVLQIFDYGSVRHPPSAPPVEYIAMEYIPGNTLRFTMSEEGLAGEDDLLREWLTAYFLPVLDGVEAIHARGIVHRDLKPENVLLDGETPKITDFGLSRSVRMRAVSNSWDIKGTWPYMAPEQFSDFRRAGETADIFSLGKILYETVTGAMDPKALPFKAVSLENSETALEKAVDAVIRKATHEDPQQRYQSVADMRRDVDTALREATDSVQGVSVRQPAPTWMPYAWAGVILAVISVLGMTLYHLAGPSSELPTAPDSPPPTQSAPRDLSLPEAVDAATLLAPNGRRLNRIGNTAAETFYADPNLITFHHYVEFLNEVAGRLDVSEGVVKNGEEIWIYIGEGNAPSDPIWFHSGRFQLRSAEMAPDPVRRVTWLGAKAYAAHYGLQLPTYAQWQFLRRIPVMAIHGAPQPLPQSPVPSSGHGPMMGSSPRTSASGAGATRDNLSVPKVHKEWVAFASDGNSRGGVVDWLSQAASEDPVRRYPWEGFDNVGFRTVMAGGADRLGASRR